MKTNYNHFIKEFNEGLKLTTMPQDDIAYISQLVTNAPRTLRQRDKLLETLKQTQRLADRALRRNEVFRGKALNEIGNVAEEAIKEVEGST